MGGLNNGEEASAVVVQVFAEIFVKEVAALAVQNEWEEIKDCWYRQIVELNRRLYEDGVMTHAPMGTALSAILLVEDQYLVAQVGDSRIYRFTDKLHQITEDQSFVAHVVKTGNMTVQQAQQVQDRIWVRRQAAAQQDLSRMMLWLTETTERSNISDI